MNTNWKIEEGGDTFIKVISFPVPDGSPVAEESMWVKKVTGTDNDGTGALDNNPAFCDEAVFGDVIRYGGGSDSKKPIFIEKAEE